MLISDVCFKRRLDIVCTLAAQDDFQLLQDNFIYGVFGYLCYLSEEHVFTKERGSITNQINYL